MIRTYTLKTIDLVDCPAISHINIKSVEGGELFYGNNKVTEILLEVGNISNLYISVGQEATEVILTYTQSYDGNNFSKEDSTVTFVFKGASEEKCLHSPSVLKNTFLTYLNSEIDLPKAYTKLISKVSCGNVFYVTPLYVKSEVPDKYKYIAQNLSIEYVGEAKLFSELPEDMLTQYNKEAISKDVKAVYLITQHNPINDSIILRSGNNMEIVDIKELFNYDYTPIIKLLERNSKHTH